MKILIDDDGEPLKIDGQIILFKTTKGLKQALEFYHKGWTASNIELEEDKVSYLITHGNTEIDYDWAVEDIIEFE